MQALNGITVIDLSQHIATPYATRLLADYGANVVKVEKPGGDVARSLPPFQGGDVHREKSGTFFMINCNKKSVVLDLKTEAGKRALEQLIRGADLVVESYRPGEFEALGFGWEKVRAIKPGVSLASISNFGASGPYRDYKLTDLVLYAFGGEMYTMGEPDREPVKMAGTAALFESGASIVAALMGAVMGGKRHGTGQHVEIALSETHFGGVDRRHATAIGFSFSGRKSTRIASHGGGMPGGIYPCADGYMEFAGAALHQDRIDDMLGRPEWNQDPRFKDPLQRINPAVVEEWNSHFLGWCIERTRREIWTEARRAKAMCAPMFTMPDLFEDEHFRGRNFWQTVTHPVMGEVTLPSRPFIMQSGGYELRMPAPLLGQHTEEVLQAAGAAVADISAILGRGVEA